MALRGCWIRLDREDLLRETVERVAVEAVRSVWPNAYVTAATEIIPEIEVSELLALDLEDLAVERAMLQALARARSVREVLLVNGREPGRGKGREPGRAVSSRARARGRKFFRRPRRAANEPIASSASGMCTKAGTARLKPTQRAAIPPICICPLTPMLKRPAWKATAKARPVNMKFVA